MKLADSSPCEQSSWFLYIIETRLKTLYTGITLDPQRRFLEHQTGGSKSAKALRGKAPLTMLFCAELNNKTNALKAEYWVKQQTKQAKLKIISGDTSLPYEHQVTELNVSHLPTDVI